MDFDDIIYLILLFSSIGFGFVYKNIGNKNDRKNIGTLVGVAVVFIVSGFNIIHHLVTVLVNAVIILILPKRQCHIASFIFTFIYLFFVRTTDNFGLPPLSGHSKMVQMVLTLKLVGLAFEVNSTSLAKTETEEDKLEAKRNDFKVSFLDIMHYSFNYVGVLTGPYYRYRTFLDYFEQPFSELSPWKEATLDKLKYIPMFAVFYLMGSYLWPIPYALTDEFYMNHGWLYRLWYVWPTFFIFRMRIYIGLVLSECVCTMAGFGAYPEITKPRPGQGPSELKALDDVIHSNSKINRNELDDKKIESKQNTNIYNFDTILNISPYGSDFCTTFREGMKHWNICVQYWLAMYVYKRFPSKKYRTAVTMLVSAAWHGVYIGYYVCIGCAPIYLMLEDLYAKLYLKNASGKSKVYLEWVFWFFKMFAFSYLGIAFHLLTLPRIYQYYNSIYQIGLIFFIVAYSTGMYLLKTRRKKE